MDKIWWIELGRLWHPSLKCGLQRQCSTTFKLKCYSIWTMELVQSELKKFTLPSLLTRPEFWYITLKLCVRLRLHWQCGRFACMCLPWLTWRLDRANGSRFQPAPNSAGMLNGSSDSDSIRCQELRLWLRKIPWYMRLGHTTIIILWSRHSTGSLKLYIVSHNFNGLHY